MFDVRLWLAIIAALMLIVSCHLNLADAHDASVATNKHDADIFQFYATWMRPKGQWPNNAHRGYSCCNRSDCFTVAEITKKNGQYVVRPENSMDWYPVSTSVIESNQEDPRESPDEKSHVCIIGGVVVCFVEGTGF